MNDFEKKAPLFSKKIIYFYFSVRKELITVVKLNLEYKWKLKKNNLL
jgi:hypothetical protein